MDSPELDLNDIPLTTIDGNATTFGEYAGKAVMVVNVASRCGNTPQYAGLEKLYEQYSDRGFTVLGFPCNQFMFQEPGSAADIKEFCSGTYGVTFPMFDKVHVNGRHQHPLFQKLTQTRDARGAAGKVEWNFEKFLISPDGAVQRFRPGVQPDAPEIIEAIERALPAA
ncbi:glutathione peroxidase [Cryobacterium mesophilum]|uniref:Glutathione peroxidase n=1 Tax=Terrimesophilobacter mesophilus TaxID=433647 RepID=A0A4R8V6G8_9MICO|nr:glutathione peroxidase [Terrimesophilobacter mesophilus]MBB5634095.1 glutathione peroxidase [Terrimesophilobacter mesophilus]TFB78681.1 glutathione peroxidase [Terrimesophilobacter mesophilus]